MQTNSKTVNVVCPNRYDIRLNIKIIQNDNSEIGVSWGRKFWTYPKEQLATDTYWCQWKTKTNDSTKGIYFHISPNKFHRENTFPTFLLVWAKITSFPIAVAMQLLHNKFCGQLPSIMVFCARPGISEYWLHHQGKNTVRLLHCLDRRSIAPTGMHIYLIFLSNFPVFSL